MATVQKFEDLEVWQLARDLCKRIYALTFRQPLAGDYRLKDQMRGSSGSIMDNISEGFDRSSRLEFVNSLSIAKGEVAELKSQLYRCVDNNYITQEVFNDLYESADVLTKRLTAFIKYLNTSVHQGLKYRDRTTRRRTTN